MLTKTGREFEVHQQYLTELQRFEELEQMRLNWLVHVGSKNYSTDVVNLIVNS